MGSFSDFSGCRNKRRRHTRDRVRAIQLERLERRLVLSATIGASVNIANGHITLSWIGDTSADDVTVTYDSVSPQFTFSDPGHNIYVPSEPYLSINNNDSSSVSVAPSTTVLFAITKINFSDGTTAGTPSGPPVSGNTYNLPTNCPGTALSVVGPASGTVSDNVTLGEANGQIGAAFPVTSITGYASPSSVDLTVDDASDTGAQIFTISPSSARYRQHPYGARDLQRLEHRDSERRRRQRRKYFRRHGHARQLRYDADDRDRPRRRDPGRKYRGSPGCPRPQRHDRHQ